MKRQENILSIMLLKIIKYKQQANKKKMSKIDKNDKFQGRNDYGNHGCSQVPDQRINNRLKLAWQSEVPYSHSSLTCWN